MPTATGLTPEIFDVDDYGQASVILDEIPAELQKNPTLWPTAPNTRSRSSATRSPGPGRRERGARPGWSIDQTGGEGERLFLAR